MTKRPTTEFAVLQAESKELGMVLSRFAKVPGRAEHWMFEIDGNLVLDFWPATMKACIPGKGAGFFVPSNRAAVDVAKTGIIPPPPTKSERQKARSICRQKYLPSEIRPKKKRRKARHCRKGNQDCRPHKPKKWKYHEYIVSPAWFARREAIFKNRGRQCERCGSTEEIQVHHLNYKRVGRERDKDLEVLCRGCHENEHEGKNGVVMDPMTRAYLEKCSVHAEES